MISPIGSSFIPAAPPGIAPARLDRATRPAGDQVPGRGLPAGFQAVPVRQEGGVPGVDAPVGRQVVDVLEVLEEEEKKGGKR